MAIYVGEAITLIGAAINPVTETVIDDATAKVEFFGPGKNPIKNPADRVVDQGPVPMTFSSTVVNKDGTTGAYVGYAETAGWQPGKWHYRVTLSGTLDSWEYGTFTLQP